MYFCTNELIAIKVISLEETTSVVYTWIEGSRFSESNKWLFHNKNWGYTTWSKYPGGSTQ